jgi:hypothetical protein
VEALEPLAGTVVRVVYDHAGCPGRCTRDGAGNTAGPDAVAAAEPYSRSRPHAVWADLEELVRLAEELASEWRAKINLKYWRRPANQSARNAVTPKDPDHRLRRLR